MYSLNCDKCNKDLACRLVDGYGVELICDECYKKEN